MRTLKSSLSVISFLIIISFSCTDDHALDITPDPREKYEGTYLIKNWKVMISGEETLNSALEIPLGLSIDPELPSNIMHMNADKIFGSIMPLITYKITTPVQSINVVIEDDVQVEIQGNTFVMNRTEMKGAFYFLNATTASIQEFWWEMDGALDNGVIELHMLGNLRDRTIKIVALGEKQESENLWVELQMN
ncbi:hypothetical protein [Fulvivirga ligni]|uniref:hypothetical protein n=1 Tax=Fulvivirga ligni TaxID=2904246 RepID=UPI001F22D136|nr:hypothetical protein [Fulvivirga ligni]UII19860.1 hypothetical protein LVD16_18620 [Fulvivirga ligni]